MKAENTTIQLPTTVFEAVADKDIEFENTLADYLPNINRIIRADADVVCEDVQIFDGKAELNGKAIFTLLYESDFKQKLRCERFSTDFTQRFELRELPEGELIPYAKARCSYVGCKTLNPRRFILRCRADLGLEIRCMQSHQTVSIEDCKGAFFKSEKHKAAVYTPQIVRDFNVDEELSLEALPPVNDIIYTSLSFAHSEVSVSEGSAVIRSEAVLKCLYEPEGEELPLQQVSRRFPAVFTVDDDAISPQSELCVDITAKTANAEKDIDAYGENRVIKLGYSARVAVNCVNRKEVTVPTDMFFEDYVNENKTAELCYEEPCKDIQHRFVLEKVFEIPDMAIDSCMDINADISVTEATVTEGGVLVKGVCGMNIFGAEGASYRAYDFSASFSENVPLPTLVADSTVKATAKATGASADILSGRLSVRIPAELTVSVKQKRAITVLSAAEIESRADNALDSKPVVIYFPAKGESAWDIGRRYHTNPAAVVDGNQGAFDKNGAVAEEGAVIYM